MIPYGIIIRQNRILMQQSILFWQKRFGILSPSKFVGTAIPVLSAFAVIFTAATVILEESISVAELFISIVISMCFIAFLLYLIGIKTVKDYALATKEENVQLVLNENALEITTEFTKEIVPYNEIDLCFEKNFLLTVITDKNAFPLSISKMHFVNGDYDMFVSLLRSKVADRYEKKGEN